MAIVCHLKSRLLARCFRPNSCNRAIGSLITQAIATNQHNEMSELGPDKDTQQITTFVDDVNIETYEKPLMSTTTAWTKMAEDDKMHDIHAILKRPVSVLSSEFNTAFTNVTLKFPDVIFQKSANVVKKLDYFTYFRANVKIRLVFNATPFMNGKYWMFFAPFDAVSNRAARLGSLPNNTGYPGVEIDLGSNAPVEIKIPYCAPLSHYNLIDTHSNMGELYIVPINPIQTGTSPVVNGATFNIFAWFDDIELAMPTSLPVTVPVLRAQVGNSEEHAATSGPSISGVAGSVASVASALGGIPLLGPWVRPVEWVSRAVSSVASTFGWNKPTNLDKNCPYSNITAKGYTNADGIDLSTKLGAMPDNGLTYDSGLFSTDIDEMDIAYVASKSCIFRSAAPWTITDAVGTILHSNAVSPGVTEGSPTNLEPTTLAYLTSMFRYWRGGLNFRIAVAKTAFHTGRLRITYHPGVYAVDPASINENAYNWILDLSVSSELEFKIPFVANVPWKETLVNPYDDTFWNREDFSTGYLTIEVLTELRRASDSVANNCPFNMWCSGADDISFAIPDFANYFVLDPTTLALTEEEKLRAQIGMLDTCEYCGRIMDPHCYPDCPGLLKAQVYSLTQTAVEHNEQVESDAQLAFPKSGMSTTTAEELTMGEKITSLRQLCKRFAPTTIGYPYPYKMETDSSVFAYPGPMPLNNDSYLFNQIEIDPAYFGSAKTTAIDEQIVSLPRLRTNGGSLTLANFAAVRNYWTSHPLHRISYLFRFFRGGKRYKVLNPPTNGISCSSTGMKDATPAASDSASFSSASDGYNISDRRPALPIFATRDWDIIENGALTQPALSTFAGIDQNPEFEHMVYPDLNGVLEFEVPYYGQTPISVVGEGTLSSVDGPLVRRSKIHLRRAHDPKGMDTAYYQYPSNAAYPVSIQDSVSAGGIRQCFGGFTLYEAAADDFSFGYLVGAPKLRRVLQP